MTPLAEKMRPKKIEDFIGQNKIVGKGKPLYNLIFNKCIPNCILYGPPGTGKTTLANIIANHTEKKFYKINATTSSIKDIQEIIDSSNSLMYYKGIILYIDEIQYFNKKQQQVLLEFLENGKVILIGSTTENPYFAIHKAIMSRCNIFSFEPLNFNDIVIGIKKAIIVLEEELSIKIEFSNESLEYIANISQGDYRKAYNILEMCVNSQFDVCRKIDIELINSLNQSNLRFDSSGDEFYNLLSAFQKSIRGSDVDASIHYLARLIKGGDITSITRRLAVISCEDIGMAHPNALAIVNSGIDLALKVGFPEANIILSQLVVYLATLPKSNSSYLAIKNALLDLERSDISDIPNHLKDCHYNGATTLNKGLHKYRYPHDYKNNYINQEYMPKNLINKKYYIPQENKYENNISFYWENIKR